jgi:hypothetical protein
MDHIEHAAQKILAVIEATYAPSHDYVRVNASDFRHLDLAFYERTTRVLGIEGFRLLADVEDRTISATPGTVLDRIMVRSMLSRDGTVMASMYHPRLKSFGIRALLWLLRKLPRPVVDMETECSDGSFVLTTNASSAALMGLPSLLSTEYHPFGTSVLRVMRRHTERVAEHLHARPGVTAKSVGTFEELVASQNRMNAIKAAYRGEVGGVTREELEQLSVFGTGLARDVHGAIQAEQMRRAS